MGARSSYPKPRDQIAKGTVAAKGGAAKLLAIQDRFTTLDEVAAGLREAGLESSNVIFGIDYTKSNEFQGTKTFYTPNLHTIDPTGRVLNPYQQVISILGTTLTRYDEDGTIPAFGFGDITTQDRRVFPFKPEGFCRGFQEVSSVYNQITPQVTLSGPTNFAPLIRESINIVKATRRYHILIIVADGQVSNEKETKDAICEASKYPLSIVMVGVGDGPWEMMKDFDDSIPQRAFDNFQFVPFNAIMHNAENPEVKFALHALMEIPDQFKAIRRLGLLNM